MGASLLCSPDSSKPGINWACKSPQLSSPTKNINKTKQQFNLLNMIWVKNRLEQKHDKLYCSEQTKSPIHLAEIRSWFLKIMTLCVIVWYCKQDVIGVNPYRMMMIMNFARHTTIFTVFSLHVCLPAISYGCDFRRTERKGAWTYSIGNLGINRM